ncbi:MAG: LCP family protein [Trueperaceae bacterium]|nr:MAG: LCP family protein [Trueperaceae bacterium]
MRRFVTSRNARLLQLFGILMSLLGLAGYWFYPEPERAEVELTTEQQELVNPENEAFQVSFVVAGRDQDYTEAASECRWEGDLCIRDRIGQFVDGQRTDTILYVHMVGEDITIIALPRDLYLEQWQTRINSMYYYQGAEGVRRAVSEILNLPIDYYVIVKLGLFENLVDALGGVEVNIPYRMYYRDAAAGLEIDFDEGPIHLSGEDAAKFIRYRDTLRGDYDRIDNVKRLAYAVVERLQEMNVRAVGAFPSLIDTFFNDVETDADLALVRRLLPKITQLQLTGTATLPTVEFEDKGYLSYDPDEVERFLADTFGGSVRSLSERPLATLLITNRSGSSDLESWYKERLVALGVPEDSIITREASLDPSPTRLLVTSRHWHSADYYASLLHASKQQIDRLPVVQRQQVDLELILGRDAADRVSSPEPVGQVSATP